MEEPGDRRPGGYWMADVVSQANTYRHRRWPNSLDNNMNKLCADVFPYRRMPANNIAVPNPALKLNGRQAQDKPLIFNLKVIEDYLMLCRRHTAPDPPITGTDHTNLVPSSIYNTMR